MARIGYLGNFTAEHSTEQQIARACRRLGHHVTGIDVRYASGRRRAVTETIRRERPDVLFYTRSNGCPLGVRWTDTWTALREAGVPIVGLHLDIFRGLPDREQLVEYGDPQFTVDVLYTADGSVTTDRWFRGFGIEHRWFPPAVDPELAAWDGLPFPGTPPVIFVGSCKSYHREHAWRQELIAGLRARYRYRFGLFGPDTLTVRGPKLSRLLASAQVVVGDCFDGGTRPYYWSDRLPETLGRGVPLVHPKAVGIDDVNLDLYPPLYLHDRHDLVDVYAAVDLALSEARRVPSVDVEARDRYLRANSWDARMWSVLDALGVPDARD